MAGKGSGALLWETLSWLDSLPVSRPEAATRWVSESVGREFEHVARRSDSGRERKVAFSDSESTGTRRLNHGLFYGLEAIDDERLSNADILEAKRTYLEYGLRRWRRFTIQHSRSGVFADHFSTLSTIPAWRAFLLIVRAMRNWKLRLQSTRSQARTMTAISSFRPSLDRKQRGYFVFLRAFARQRRARKARWFGVWRRLFQRASSLRRLIQKRQRKDALVVWRRRSRWPLVLKHWGLRHLRAALHSWRVTLESSFPRSSQLTALELARVHMFRRCVRRWHHSTSIVFKRREDVHARLSHYVQVRYVASVWPEWRRQLHARRSQRELLAQASDFRRCRLLGAGWRDWARILGDRAFVRRHAQLTRHHYLRKLLHRWFRNSHEHSVYVFDRSTSRGHILRDSIFHFMGSYLARMQSVAAAKKADRLSQLLYRRSTMRHFMRWWREYAIRSRWLCYELYKGKQVFAVHKRKALWRALLRWRRAKALMRLCRLRDRRLAQRWALRYWAQRARGRAYIKLRLYRAELRFQAATRLSAVERWHAFAQTHALLRRKFKLFVTVYRSKYLLLSSPLLSDAAATSPASWPASTWINPSAESLAVLSSTATDGPEIRHMIHRNIVYRNFKLISIVWHHWAKVYLPRKRALAVFTAAQRRRRAMGLLGQHFERWLELCEERWAAQVTARSAVRLWRTWVDGGKARRLQLLSKYRAAKKELRRPRALRYILLLAASKAKLPYELYRCFARWRERVVHVHGALRRASLGKYCVQRHLLTLQRHKERVIDLLTTNRLSGSWNSWTRLRAVKAAKIWAVNVRIVGRLCLRRWVRMFNRQVMLHTLSLRGEVAFGHSISAIDENSASNRSLLFTPTSGKQVTRVLKFIGDTSCSPGAQSGENGNRSRLSCASSATPVAWYRIRPLDSSCSTPLLNDPTGDSAAAARQRTCEPRSVDKQKVRRGYYLEYQRRMLSHHSESGHKSSSTSR